MNEDAALVLDDVRVSYGKLVAVDGVSLSVRRGEILGLVGESGCGKTTLAKALVGLTSFSGGSMKIMGRDALAIRKQEKTSFAGEIQLLFQDPVASLSPRMSIGELIAEPLKIRRADTQQQRDRLQYLLNILGLPKAVGRLYPHQLSGGQARRISLIRALAMEPKVLVADEPTAGLDVSVQGDVLNLIRKIQREFNLTTILISHNLNIVGRITQRVAIMYLGKIVELGSTREVFARPAHPYTVALLAANPVLNAAHKRNRVVLRGEPPSPLHPPSGCRFHTRCPIAQDRCRVDPPELTEVGASREAACHFPFVQGTA